MLLAVENEGITFDTAPLDVFIVVGEDADRTRVVQVLSELRRRGVSADTDYAGRSFKGQMTQAGRTGARTVVIVRGSDAALRRDGRDEEVVSLDALVTTLTA